VYLFEVLKLFYVEEKLVLIRYFLDTFHIKKTAIILSKCN